jgi:hypothetical protein
MGLFLDREGVMPLATEWKVALLAAGVTVGLAVVGGAYKLGYDEGAKDLEAVNDFRKIDLPKMLANLKELSADLQARESLRREKDQLAKESAERGKELERLEKEASGYSQEKARLQKQIDDLRVKLSAIMPRDDITLQISEGEAKRVIPNVLTIAVRTLYAPGTSDLNINGSTKGMYVGDRMSVLIGDSECRIELTKVEKPLATLVLSCPKK